MKKNTLFLVLLCVLCALLSVLGLALYKNKNTPSTPSIQFLPNVQLKNLFDENASHSVRTLLSKDEYGLVNVWGSWCHACAVEHDFLMSIKEDVTLIGVNWYDETASATQFLDRLGNPYQTVLKDDEGVFSVAMGLQGAPESFLIKGERVLASHKGVLNSTVWASKFLPLLPQHAQVAEQ